MAWAEPQYSKGKVDWAGKLLASDPVMFTPEVSLAEDIVDNWRAVHSYPLQAMKMTLKRRAKRIDRNATVAQRLKRLASIKFKLRHSSENGNHPKLSQMQDIGGCRAVMETVKQVRRLEQVFAEASRKAPNRGPLYSKSFDYITFPKANGYRGIHLVYKYRTGSSAHSCYNGQRIEIQIRSRLQHYWATAVETYSTFSGEALKSNVGSESWKRFFALMGSVLAMREGCPTVPGTPAMKGELIPELHSLYTQLNVGNVLSGWSAATRMTGEAAEPEFKNAAMYLLILDPSEFSIEIRAFQKDELAKANAEYAQVERESPNLQAVLVSVDSVAALRTAYPNYFLDTSAFLEEVEKAIGEKPR